MMKPLSLFAVADACGVVRSSQDVIFSRVVTDSRQVQRGDLFVALQGERFDAHQFLPEVQVAGAVAAIVEKENAALTLPQLCVPNAVEALGKIAALNRTQFTGKIIGLTGSAGKTTTKEMIAAILAQQGKPLVTQGNLNNHLGVPLTLLSISPENDSAVIEMGASAMGEIHYLTQLVKPHVALVTNVAPAHLEGFGSIENVAKGKREIFDGLPTNGIAIINVDNEWTATWRHVVSTSFSVLTFSLRNTDADVFTSDIVQTTEGLRFNLHYQQKSHVVVLAFLGLHNVGNAVAAAACCLALGISLGVVAKGLCAARPYKGRLQLKKGIHQCSVIDDSYNANPASVRMAIDALLACDGKKVLVLGDMGELGADAQSLHEAIGHYAKNAGVKTLLATGALSRFTVSAFGAGAQHFEQWQQLAAHCSAIANQQTIFLIKGSRSAGMDRVADQLVEHGETIC